MIHIRHWSWTSLTKNSDFIPLPWIQVLSLIFECECFKDFECHCYYGSGRIKINKILNICIYKISNLTASFQIPPSFELSTPRKRCLIEYTCAIVAAITKEQVQKLMNVIRSEFSIIVCSSLSDKYTFRKIKKLRFISDESFSKISKIVYLYVIKIIYRYYKINTI